jgi:hypothetical protein
MVQRQSSSKQLQIECAGTIGYGIGFVNSAARVQCALKVLEKPGAIVEMSLDAGPLVRSRPLP